jgi:hypothetical protein
MHPTAEELRIFSTGEPSNEFLARIEEHLLECGHCALAVVEFVRESMRVACSKRDESTGDEFTTSDVKTFSIGAQARQGPKSMIMPDTIPPYITQAHFNAVMKLFIERLYRARIEVVALEKCLIESGVISEEALCEVRGRLAAEANDTLDRQAEAISCELSLKPPGPEDLIQ